MDINYIENGFWSGRRVFITGHTGFKGSWLVLWLLQLGAEVHGFSIESDSDPSSQVLFESLSLGDRLGARHRIGDIRDAFAITSAVEEVQPEVVIHLAAQPLVRLSYEDPVKTWSTNVQGSLNLLEALRPLRHRCAVVMVTTDKVYANCEWEWGYREQDRLGGHDPYSASKAAMELLVSSWRSSFCGNESHQTSFLAVASARAGNVIGGGDWAIDRIVPDAMRAVAAGQSIGVRSPRATRPWQHVLEPLAGYLQLAQALYIEPLFYSRPFNFGPSAESNRSVEQLVEQLLFHWDSAVGWHDLSGKGPHEAGFLHLVSDRAQQQLGWRPRWSFTTTVARTAQWYKRVHYGESVLQCCLDDLDAFTILRDDD